MTFFWRSWVCVELMVEGVLKSLGGLEWSSEKEVNRNLMIFNVPSESFYDSLILWVWAGVVYILWGSHGYAIVLVLSLPSYWAHNFTDTSEFKEQISRFLPFLWIFMWSMKLDLLLLQEEIKSSSYQPSWWYGTWTLHGSWGQEVSVQNKK